MALLGALGAAGLLIGGAGLVVRWGSLEIAAAHARAQAEAALRQKTAAEREAAQRIADLERELLLASELQREASGLAEEVARLQRMEADLRAIAGLDPPAEDPSKGGGRVRKATLDPAADPGIGSRGGGAIGPDQIALLREELPELRDRLGALVELSQELRERYRRTPAQWPARGPVSSVFGYRRSPFGGGVEFHAGIDIAVGAGQPVRATADGHVRRAGWDGAYGLAIVLDHGNGLETVYGHNSRLLVKQGERVKRGQVIARSGSTGRSSGPHVHYEVRRRGVPINPAPYLERPDPLESWREIVEGGGAGDSSARQGG